jgi:hypothetical protein
MRETQDRAMGNNVRLKALISIRHRHQEASSRPKELR